MKKKKKTRLTVPLDVLANVILVSVHRILDSLNHRVRNLPTLLQVVTLLRSGPENSSSRLCKASQVENVLHIFFQPPLMNRGSLDIDRRRQGEEEDKSDEGFGEHLEN
jgi:hypothetical protein